MKKLVLASLAILSLSACAAAPEPTLSQKIERKSRLEKVNILYSKCMQEAAWRKTGGGTYLNTDAYHARNLREICKAMAKEMGALQISSPQSDVLEEENSSRN